MRIFVMTALLAVSSCGNTNSTPGNGGTDATAADLCEFVPGEAQWVVEGEELEIELLCGSQAALTDLEVGDLPAGAILNTAENVIQWTPGWEQAAVYTLQLKSELLHASAVLTIGVADAYGHPSNLPIQDFSKYTMELGLPVVFLEQKPSESGEYEATSVTYGGQSLSAEVKIRGKSSLSYPKNSYALRFDKSSRFTESEFADFANRTRVILTSTFDDNAYFRQRMAYDLWSRLQPTIRIAAYNVIVYFGEEYRGIYTISDHVNGELMQRSGLSSGGNLYKAETHDANFRRTDYDGATKPNLHMGYTKTEGKPKDSFADLEDLVQFVADSDDATFNAGIAQRIDIDQYVAWWMLTTFLLASDSVDKNSYHYHDQTRTWRVVPWDFNASLGQSWNTQRLRPTREEFFYEYNEIFLRLAAHPVIGPAIKARYKTALQTGAFEKDSLQALIASYEAQLLLSAERDWKRWQDEYRNYPNYSSRTDFTTQLEEVAYVKQWVFDRWQFALDTYAQ